MENIMSYNLKDVQRAVVDEKTTQINNDLPKRRVTTTEFIFTEPPPPRKAVVAPMRTIAAYLMSHYFGSGELRLFSKPMASPAPRIQGGVTTSQPMTKRRRQRERGERRARGLTAADDRVHFGGDYLSF